MSQPPMDPFSLNGRVALVTGSTTGPGKAMAIVLGHAGAKATEVAPWGITVNMISPGSIPVERHANDPQQEKDGYRALVPAGRWGIPQDLAGAIVFLASEASSFVTAQNLHVNGG